MQKESWPKEGKHILAQYADDYVVVYQAYRPEIGLFAAKHQYFGGAFSFTRMSWIIPNFLWMMYRSGWGKKVGQEIALAIYLRRNFFNRILLNAFPSTNINRLPKNDWKQHLLKTNVRLQWDPDHDPFGKPLERRAIQLGLRNEFLVPFKGEGILKIEDISDYVSEQWHLLKSGELNKLSVPKEDIYPVNSELRKIIYM